MRQVVIENPIINSPFAEPTRHFRFDEGGITNELVEARRVSQYFVPIAKPRKKTQDKQLIFDEWTEDRIEENKTVNEIRRLVKLWREGRYQDDVTRQTARLLEYWCRDDRTRRLFFCQIEALETLIYITEVAKKYGHTWIENDLRRFNEDSNAGLLRIASKMATGSGKTVVMAMLIAWHVLNKQANNKDARFTDTFLLVTPGELLQVLRTVAEERRRPRQRTDAPRVHRGLQQHQRLQFSLWTTCARSGVRKSRSGWRSGCWNTTFATTSSTSSLGCSPTF